MQTDIGFKITKSYNKLVYTSKAVTEARNLKPKTFSHLTRMYLYLEKFFRQQKQYAVFWAGLVLSISVI